MIRYKCKNKTKTVHILILVLCSSIKCSYLSNTHPSFYWMSIFKNQIINSQSTFEKMGQPLLLWRHFFFTFHYLKICLCSISFLKKRDCKEFDTVTKYITLVSLYPLPLSSWPLHNFLLRTLLNLKVITKVYVPSFISFIRYWRSDYIVFCFVQYSTSIWKRCVWVYENVTFNDLLSFIIGFLINKSINKTTTVDPFEVIQANTAVSWTFSITLWQ